MGQKPHPIRDNAQHAQLRTPRYRQQVVKPKRGKGSYRRKWRRQGAERV